MKKATGILELHSKPAGGFTSASGFRCAEQSCAHFSEHHLKILINTLGSTHPWENWIDGQHRIKG